MSPPKGNGSYKVALIYPKDHGNIGIYADLLKGAFPGTRIDKVADLVHEAFVALKEKIDAVSK